MIGPASAPLVAAAINRLTRPAPLSSERLARFAGRTALFRVGLVAVALTVQTTGEVLPAQEAAAADLEVRISPFLLPRLAAHDEAAYRDVGAVGDLGVWVRAGDGRLVFVTSRFSGMATPGRFACCMIIEPAPVPSGSY